MPDNTLKTLLDNGWRVRFFANCANCYTAVARRGKCEECFADETPELAVERLARHVARRYAGTYVRSA